MLDPFIISEILKKEKAEREGVDNREQLPAPAYEPAPQPTTTPVEESERGVLVIDI